jgi:hypothetical protein
MKAYPKIGTRVRLTGGKFAGRQARTDSSEGYGRGRIALWLLGGVLEIGISEELRHVEKDPERRIHKLAPRPLTYGDKLYSLKGSVFPIGHSMVLGRESRGQFGREFVIDSTYTPMSIAPRPGFEKRWCHDDGAPISLEER